MDILSRIWTPFQKCENFEPRLICVIDQYLETEHKLVETFTHWCLAWQLTNGYNRGFIQACTTGDLTTAKLLYPHLFERKDKKIMVIDKAFQGAVTNGYLHIAKYLIRRHPNKDLLRLDNYYLTQACVGGHLDLVKYLSSLGADFRGLYDKDALGNAAANGHLSIVKYLVSLDKRIFLDMNYALQLAAGEGHLDIVKYLMSSGAQIITEDEGPFTDENEGPFITAAANGHFHVVKYFVDIFMKTDVTVADVARDGLIPVASNGHLDMIKYLQSLGVDANIVKNDCLYCAALYGHIDTVKYFVSLGADVSFGCIVHAAAKGHLEVLKYLVSYKPDNFTANTIYKAILESAQNGHLEVVQYLISLGDTTIYYDVFDQACASGHLELVKYVVSLGVDLTTATLNEGFEQACARGHLEMVKYLVSLGADMTANNNSAFAKAAENGHIHVLKYLNNMGVCITNRFRLNSIVIESVSNFHYQTVKYLIDNCDFDNILDGKEDD